MRVGLVQALGVLAGNDSLEASPSERLNSLALKVLVKTILKCALWFGLAWLITQFRPGALWPWYAAFALAGIGMAFSLLALLGAFVASAQERRAASESDR